MFSSEDLFFALYSHITPLHSPRCTSKTMKSISQCYYFTSELYRKKKYTHIYICGSQSQGGRKKAYFWNILALQFFLSRCFHAVSLQLEDIYLVSALLLDTTSVNPCAATLFNQINKDMFISPRSILVLCKCTRTHIHRDILRQTQNVTPPPFSNAETAYP